MSLPSSFAGTPIPSAFYAPPRLTIPREGLQGSKVLGSEVGASHLKGKPPMLLDSQPETGAGQVRSARRRKTPSDTGSLNFEISV